MGRTDAEAETSILWPPDVKNWLTGKDPDAGKDWRQEEKGMTEDEMVGWHQWLHGYEFKQSLGVGDGQGSLACCSPWGHQESDTTEWLNWTESQNLVTDWLCQIRWWIVKGLLLNCEQLGIPFSEIGRKWKNWGGGKYLDFHFVVFFFSYYFYSFFFSFIFISWRLITSQHFSGFCHTSTWISHGVTCILHSDLPSHLPLHPIPLGLPVHQAWALVSCIPPGLVICFTIDNIHAINFALLLKTKWRCQLRKCECDSLDFSIKICTTYKIKALSTYGWLDTSKERWVMLLSSHSAAHRSKASTQRDKC